MHFGNSVQFAVNVTSPVITESVVKPETLEVQPANVKCSLVHSGTLPTTSPEITSTVTSAFVPLSSLNVTV